MFPLDIKSTLDKVMHDIQGDLIGEFPSLKALDIDNLAEPDAVGDSVDPTLLWQFSVLDPSPRDPLYIGSFLVGAKTTDDNGNYLLTTLLSKLIDYFQIDTQLPISDYSGITSIDGRGVLNITSIILSPQQYDNLSGVRTYSVSFTAQRLI
jgi:hypothetical protein